MLGIASVILGVFILAIPGLKAMTTGMLMYIMAGWFVVQGIVSICRAVKMKKNDGGSRNLSVNQEHWRFEFDRRELK